MRKILDWTFGLTLIAIGIVGGFVPIFQGWIFVLAGLAVLSSHSSWARFLHDRVKRFGRNIRDRVRPTGSSTERKG